MDANSQDIQDIENSAREIRLAEQSVFRATLANKSRKFKRGLFFLAGVFLAVSIVWVLLHCVPLMRQAQ